MPNLHSKGGTEALLQWHIMLPRGGINACTHQLQLYTLIGNLFNLVLKAIYSGILNRHRAALMWLCRDTFTALSEPAGIFFSSFFLVLQLLTSTV